VSRDVVNRRDGHVSHAVLCDLRFLLLMKVNLTLYALQAQRLCFPESLTT
jgi:hypothetical protein